MKDTELNPKKNPYLSIVITSRNDEHGDNALKLTRALSEEAGIPVNVRQSSAIALPFPDESFDCVDSFGLVPYNKSQEKRLKIAF